MSRAKRQRDPEVVDTPVGKLRRKKNYGEDDERLAADAVERVRAALSPLDQRTRRRVLVAIAAVFGDVPLVHAIMGVERVLDWNAHTRSWDLVPPPGVSL